MLDPVDGSTNASRRIPWFATSICVLDDTGPFAALVVNQATESATRRCAGGRTPATASRSHPRARSPFKRAFIGFSGYPPRYLGWRQFRALGAAALDLCAVADGSLDGYIDCMRDAHGSWDYLGGLLVCT